MPESDTTHDRPVVPDGWELADSRWATLWIDGTPHRLKPPKLGEFRKITELIDVATSEVLSHTNALVERLDEMRTAIEEGRSDSEALKALNQELGNQQRDFIHNAWWGVLTEIFEALGDKPLPPEDELPVWVSVDANNEIAALSKHWRTSPPHRGGHP